jgi:hypothetical protein
MRNHLRRLATIGALGITLLIIGIGGAASVSADSTPTGISPAAYQKVGCANGDLACFQARLNGSVPLTVPYCDGSGCTSNPVGDSVAIPNTSVGTTPVTIDPVAYQKLGCTNGDLNCFYARLNGSVPITTPYCDGYGCTSVQPNDSSYTATVVPPTTPVTGPVQTHARSGLMPALMYR